MPFDGLRILSLESRRSEEMAVLIRKQGGEPFAAPSMREVPLEANTEAFSFAEDLLAGHYDGIILLTGVGTRMLWRTLLQKFKEAELKAALSRITRIVRGPKPSAALRELEVPAHVQVPEPNTWRELLTVMQARPETRLALQEYGKPSTELIAGLRAQGKTVSPFRIYGWDLPEDTTPLRSAAHRLAVEDFDIAVFTTSIQINHLLRIAAEEDVEEKALSNLRKMVIASIGPTTSEALLEFGVAPDFEPSHPKMGFLVSELAACAHGLLAAKQSKSHGAASISR